MGIDSQLMKGVLEGCVLKLLYGEEMFSMQIVLAMREKGFVDFSEGTLYPMLMRLDKEGCFIIRKVESKNSPPRKYYSLSATGREKLNSFLKDWENLTQNVNTIIK